MIRAAILLLFMAASAASAAPRPADGVTHVRVAGHWYKVTVAGRLVRSASVGRPWAGETLRERDAQREAIRKATGCRIADELDMNGAPKISGRLDCSDGARPR